MREYRYWLIFSIAWPLFWLSFYLFGFDQIFFNWLRRKRPSIRMEKRPPRQDSDLENDLEDIGRHSDQLTGTK